MINYKLATVPKRIIIFFTTFLVIVTSIYLCLGYIGKKQVTPVVQSLLQEWQDIFQISYKSLSWEPLSQTVILSGVELAQRGSAVPLTTIKRVALKVERENGRLISVNAVLKKMKMDIHSDAVEDKNNFLSQLGYSELDSTVILDYHFFPQGQAAAISIDAKGKKWGAFTAVLDVENFNPTGDIVFDYPTIVVRKARFTFKDKGFVSRLTAVLARQEGLSRHFYIEDFKRSFLSQEDPPLLWKEHFVTFLSTPQYFSIELSAQKRLTVAEIISTWPEVVKTNESMRVFARSESLSLTEWCELYFNKIQQEFFAQKG